MMCVKKKVVQNDLVLPCYQLFVTYWRLFPEMGIGPIKKKKTASKKRKMQYTVGLKRESRHGNDPNKHEIR